MAAFLTVSWEISDCQIPRLASSCAKFRTSVISEHHVLENDSCEYEDGVWLPACDSLQSHWAINISGRLTCSIFYLEELSMKFHRSIGKSLTLFMGIPTLERETTRLSRNVGYQPPSDAASRPRRTETSRALLRDSKKSHVVGSYKNCTCAVFLL